MFSRTITVTDADGTTENLTFDFGVTGALYSANVLMYDRTDKALWSQMAMQAVSGPHVGTRLTHLPARIMPFFEFKMLHPKGKVISKDTGRNAPYDRSPYADYFRKEDLMVVPVKGVGSKLPKKALGMGILAGDKAYFVPATAIGDGRTVPTPLGDVVLSATHRGDHWSVSAGSVPAGVQTIQTLYLGWSAFYPDSELIGVD